MSTVLFWISMALLIGALVRLLQLHWNDREAELFEDTMRRRHMRRVGDEEEQKWTA